MEFDEIKKDIYNELNDHGKNELDKAIRDNNKEKVMELYETVTSQRNMFMEMHGESFHNPME